MIIVLFWIKYLLFVYELVLGLICLRESCGIYEIKGIVFDDSKEFLIGVSVFIKGILWGIVMDFDGKFVLYLEEKCVDLYIIYMGYEVLI